METLRQEYLEIVAGNIDATCSVCAKNLHLANPLRQIIDENLVELLEAYQSLGVDITQFVEALRQTCQQCFSTGRTAELTARFTCGIRVRVQEPENHAT